MSTAYTETLNNLIEQLAKLPGVGPKTAERLAFHILRTNVSEAVALAEEMLEALRNHRDGVPWSQDDPGIEYDGLGVLGLVPGDFHLKKSTDTPPRWMIVAGSEVIRKFTRAMEFERLERDANDDIVPSGTGTPDEDSVEVTVTVSWMITWAGISRTTTMILWTTTCMGPIAPG